MILDDIKGKRVLVTGGSSGIGAAAAKGFHDHGADVAVHYFSGEKAAKALAATMNAGGKVALVSGDVRKPDDAAAIVAQTVRALGGLDVLVNNAGAGGPNGCAEPGPDRWDEIVRTNLDGTFYTTRAALPHLGDGGRIVSVSSVLGRFGVPGYTAYCASKHGVIGFTKALALELAPRRVTVNAVCPGWVDTEMAAAGMQLMADGMQVPFDEAKRQALAAVPLGRMLEPEEIGELVVYLCSHAARGMTGQAISHCGGQVMW